MTARWVRRVVLGVHVLGVSANGVMVVIGDLPLVNGAAAAFNAAFFAFYIRKFRKEDANGRHREAEASSRDPGDFTVTIAADPTGLTAALTAAARSGSSLTYHYSTGGVIGNAPAEPEVERVESSLPILAHRVANLQLDGTSKPFRSLNEGVPFGIEADACCRSYSRLISYRSFTSSKPTNHAAPELGCQCGFYALPSDVEPWSESGHYVTLQVELSGTVIEHERGYRAGHQRVVEVQVPPCPLCLRAATAIQVNDDHLMVRSCCDIHLIDRFITVHLDDLRSVLGVTVTARDGR